jgi:hypothetical protein
VTKDLNTLLTALYVLVDDLVVPARAGRGHRPDLTDSELICLAVALIMLGYHNERRWVRHVHADSELLGMFPDMLTQSGYHKRLKTAEPLLCKAIIVLATGSRRHGSLPSAGLRPRVAQAVGSRRHG